MRIILYTGKGGVGKTSVSAATAAEIASRGKKVLVMSTDQAHSLSDSFDQKLGKEPTYISENLYGMELDTVEENEKNCGGIMGYMKQLITLNKGDSIEVEELLVFPGLEELLALLKIKEIYEQNKYDVLIVDCAPTGETMSLLKFPQLFKWWIEKLLPSKRKMTKIAKPVVEKTMKIPMPEDELFDEIDELYNKLEKLQELMQNKEIVSLRIVTTPEKIVIKEAMRSFSFLHLYDYNVDGVVVNKIFPKDSMKSYFSKWCILQEEGIKQIQTAFSELPIFYLPLKKSELRGNKMLVETGKELFKELEEKNKSSEEILFTEKIYEVIKTEEGYTLRIKMPFVDKKELSLSQNGDEILLAIKNEKRSFILPSKLLSREILGAQYKEDHLEVRF